MTEVTRILDQIQQGDPHAAEQLLPLIYDELRKLAAQKLAHEKPGQTLDSTALVHEAYIRLVANDKAVGATGPHREIHWNSRGHFFAAAAEAMRRILVENARRKRRFKHGGSLKRIELMDAPALRPVEDVLALNEALDRLAAEDAIAAKIVELHYFAGLRHEHVANTLGITVYQARQKWTYARAWLRNALGA